MADPRVVAVPREVVEVLSGSSAAGLEPAAENRKRLVYARIKEVGFSGLAAQALMAGHRPDQTTAIAIESLLARLSR